MIARRSANLQHAKNALTLKPPTTRSHNHHTITPGKCLVSSTPLFLCTSLEMSLASLQPGA